MEDQVVACGMELGIVIDALLVVFFWCYIARLWRQWREATRHYLASSLSFDDNDDDEVIDVSEASDYQVLRFGTGYLHGPLINPASGLPMLDDTGLDAAGNPYGTDFSSDFQRSFDTSGSDRFHSGCGIHEW